MKKPRAGDLNFRVSFLKKVRIQDSTTKEETIDYQHWFDAWADVQPLSANELLRVKTLDHVITHKVTVRYFDGLNYDHAIKFKEDRILNIDTIINPDEHNIWYQLLCREVKR